VTQLASIAEIRMGATLRGRDATRPVPSGSYRLVRIGDISQDGTWLNRDFVHIEPGQPVSEDQVLRSGDVLFPNRGTRTTALAYRLDQGRTIAGAQFFVLRPEMGRVVPEFLAWFLRTEEAAEHFSRRRKGTYVQIVERKDLADFEMPLPPLAVQQKIVAAAELAVAERNLAERLAGMNWRLKIGQLSQAARSAVKGATGAPREGTRPTGANDD
jgi:restriction endonuclease S subunit